MELPGVWKPTEKNPENSQLSVERWLAIWTRKDQIPFANREPTLTFKDPHHKQSAILCANIVLLI